MFPLMRRLEMLTSNAMQRAAMFKLVGLHRLSTRLLLVACAFALNGCAVSDKDVGSASPTSPEFTPESNVAALQRLRQAQQPAAADYAERVRRKVKSNLAFDPDTVNGNPVAVVAVQMAPDGSILSRRLMQSSGNRPYDEAVLRAVERSDPLPRDINGTAPPRIVLHFRPR